MSYDDFDNILRRKCSSSGSSETTQAPTFLGQEGTKIEMLHFDKYDRLSIQINVKMSL